MGKLTFRDIFWRIVVYFVLAGFAFLMIFPFLYMISTSLKTTMDVFNVPPRLLPYSAETVTVDDEERTLYNIEVDGITYQMVKTDDRQPFSFYTTEDLINRDNHRNSEILVQQERDAAVETGEIVTLMMNDGREREFDVYDVTVEGETQQLLLAYNSTLNLYVVPDNPEISTYVAPNDPVEYVEFQWENYQYVFGLNPEVLQLDRAFVNTTLVTVLVVAGQLITSIFGGYAFSRVRFRGRDALFLVYLGSIMIPFIVLIIPIFRLMVILGWDGQLASLIIPWIFTAYGTFLMRQFFIAIPIEIEEAALMDGASRMRILWTIFVPLSRPAIATLAIFSFLYAWNSFLWPLLIIGEGTVSNHVLTLALIRLTNSFQNEPNVVLTGAAIAIIPPMIVFVMAQKYFIEGVATSGLKG
jgi:ABC-type glycerol-3-phosphate transport system permease component